MPKWIAISLAVLCLGAASGVALAQFDQAPSAPLPFTQAPSSSAFDVQVHSRDSATWSDNGLEAMQAQHGADCSGPPASHINTSYAGAVFICNNHVMTAINAGGYGEIVLTPSQMADWSTGAATVQWEISTERASSRDWPDIWVTPWDQNITLPFDEGDVDNQGIPRTGIHVSLADTENAWLLTTIRNGVQSAELNSRYSTPPLSAGITAGTNQAATRQTFRLTISASRLRLERLGSATASPAVYYDGSAPDLGFSQGVVQFAHHSYNPTKDGAGVPATWHWDEMTVSPAVSFQIIKTHTRAVFGNGSVVFDSPAPANSWLRFSAVGSVQYSVNGGSSYQTAPKQAFIGHYEHASPYFIPVPAGTQTVLFRFGTDNWYQGPFVAQDFAIWSRSGQSSPPPPMPSPTKTPVPATPPPPVATATSTPVTPQQDLTASARVGSASVARGQSQNVTVTVVTSKPGNGLVDIEIYDPAGKKVHQTYMDNQSFAAGTARSFTANWAPPANAPVGKYTVRVGIFGPGWSSLLLWNNAAATFTVS